MGKAGTVNSFYDVVWASSIHHHVRIAIPLPDWNAASIKPTSKYRPVPNFPRDGLLRNLAPRDTSSAMHPSYGFEWRHTGGVHSRPYTHAGSLICMERILSQVWNSPLAIPLLKLDSYFRQRFIHLLGFNSWGLCRYLYVCAATA